MNVLITGGCGYIGSHTCVQFIQAGHIPVIVDNLCNAKASVISRIQALTGFRPVLHIGDVRDAGFLDSVFASHQIDAVIHFAGLKAVGESVRLPLAYYDNNVTGTLRLVEAMERAGVRQLVFSSSATVYGDPHEVPIREDFPTAATNPYGQTKLTVELMLRDLVQADERWSITLLRYFNPVGAHPSASLGEDPQGIPNNLMPFLAQVAVGRRAELQVFGNDYATVDGTGVRDYIHVMDLADGHLAALAHGCGKPGCHTFNLGTGKGTSVLEMLHSFSRACGRPLPYRIVARRPGDVAACWADPAKAASELGWSATHGIDDMTTDTWRWQSANPTGYPNE